MTMKRGCADDGHNGDDEVNGDVVNDDIGDDNDEVDDEDGDEDDDDGDWPASSPCSFSPSFRNLSISATACSRFSTWVNISNTFFPRMDSDNDWFPRNNDQNCLFKQCSLIMFQKDESHDDVFVKILIMNGIAMKFHLCPIEAIFSSEQRSEVFRWGRRSFFSTRVNVQPASSYSSYHAFWVSDNGQNLFILKPTRLPPCCLFMATTLWWWGREDLFHEE